MILTCTWGTWIKGVIVFYYKIIFHSDEILCSHDNVLLNKICFCNWFNIPLRSRIFNSWHVVSLVICEEYNKFKGQWPVKCSNYCPKAQAKRKRMKNKWSNAWFSLQYVTNTNFDIFHYLLKLEYQESLIIKANTK